MHSEDNIIRDSKFVKGFKDIKILKVEEISP